MKKQELFDILIKGEIIHKGVDQDNMFDILEDLAYDFYSNGSPKPEDIAVECTTTEEN